MPRTRAPYPLNWPPDGGAGSFGTIHGEGCEGLPGKRAGEEVAILAYDADAVVLALVPHGITFAQLQVRPASLEEAFIDITEVNNSSCLLSNIFARRC